MPRYASGTIDAFSRQFGYMWALSILAHVVFLGVFTLIAPGPGDAPAAEKSEVLMFDLEDLSDLPEGPGVGPIAPTKDLAAKLNPFAPKPPDQSKEKVTAADILEKTKPVKKAPNTKQRSFKTQQAFKAKREQSAIDRLRNKMEQTGGGGTGASDGGSVTKIYVAGVRAKIRGRWKLPTGLTAEDKNRTAKVVVRIDSSGNLLGYSISGSSGLASLDASIKQAIQSAGPFNAPPGEAAEKVAAGIGFTFKAKEAQ